MILADTFKDDFSSFLQNYALFICLGFIALIILTIVIIYVIKNRKNKVAEVKPSNDVNLFIEHLGGKDNIVDVSAVGSRLSLTLKDQNLINEDIKNMGVTSIMKMSEKVILLMENSAAETAETIQKSLQKED